MGGFGTWEMLINTEYIKSAAVSNFEVVSLIHKLATIFGGTDKMQLIKLKPQI